MPSTAPALPQQQQPQAASQGHFDAAMQRAIAASLQQAPGCAEGGGWGGGWGGGGSASRSYVDLTAASETHGKQADEAVVCLDSEEDEAVVCLDDGDEDDEGELEAALRMSMEGGWEQAGGGSALPNPLPVNKPTQP
jgi:hypothetical protein